MSDAKSSEIVPASQSNPLRPDDLASRINAAHEEVKNSIRRGAEHAIIAGRLLLEAKANAGHGNFLEWVSANCNFRPRTAQVYMTMAENFPLLEARSNAQRIAHLSLNEAVRMLKEPSEKPAGETADDRNEEDTLKDTVAKAIKKNGALVVLKRAWDAAGDTQRRSFVRACVKPDNTAPPG